MPVAPGLLSVGVSQLSFFSAESVPPAVTDLTGLLAAGGQVVLVGGGARLSVVVDRPWRAEAIAEMVDEAGLEPGGIPYGRGHAAGSHRGGRPAGDHRR